MFVRGVLGCAGLFTREQDERGVGQTGRVGGALGLIDGTVTTMLGDDNACLSHSSKDTDVVQCGLPYPRSPRSPRLPTATYAAFTTGPKAPGADALGYTRRRTSEHEHEMISSRIPSRGQTRPPCARLVGCSQGEVQDRDIGLH